MKKRSGAQPVGYRGKRAFDLLIAVPALIASAPIQLVVAIAVRLRLGKPVLFRQERPGLHHKVFILTKFRTMRPERHPGEPEEKRVDVLGQLLRSTSLDELPSLWNVVKGDMSLIGPRPLLVRYLPRYSPEQLRRHDVRPGITGLAQVSGRNEVGWDERLAIDVWYVDHCSFRLDCWILLRTIATALRREGITPRNSKSMPEFGGSPHTNETDPDTTPVEGGGRMSPSRRLEN